MKLISNDEFIDDLKREYLTKDNETNPMLKKNDVENYARLHNQVEEKIHEIIRLHSDIDDRYYEIKEIEAQDGYFLVYLEYFKWQDINHHSISIEFDLLYDQLRFDNLINKAKQEKYKRLKELEEKKQQQLEQKLIEARKLLSTHGEI